MKIIPAFIILLSALSLLSCQEEASIFVTNKLPHVTLYDISFGEYHVGGDLLPGESTYKYGFERPKDEFPIEAPVAFMMEKNGHTVYLITRNSYKLQAGDDLEIIIDDSTEVFNPVLE